MKAMRLFHNLVRTFRGRLILSVAMVHAVMMTVVVSDLILRQQDQIVRQEVVSATALARSLAASGAVWIASGDIAGLQEIVDSQRGYPELQFAFLIDNKGRVLAHTDPSKRGLYVTDIPPDGPPVVLSQDTDLVDVAVPALVAGQRTGWARVGLGQKGAGQRSDAVAAVGVLYAGLTVVLGSLIAWLMGLRITRRLYSIQSAIGQVRQGNTRARASVTGIDEAASIAHEFNALLDALDQRSADLVRSEEKYRTLIRDIQVAVVVHGSDSRIQMANVTAQSLLGLSDRELDGMEASHPYWSFSREDGNPLVPEEYPVNWVLKHRKSFRNQVIGIARPEQIAPRWALVNAVPVWKPSQEIDQVIVTFVDISERKEGELRLQKLNEWFTLATTAAHLGLWDWDLRQNRLVWDDQMFALYGISRQESPNASEIWLQGVHPDDRERCRQESDRALRGEAAYDMEYRVIWPDRSVHSLKAFGQIVRAEDGTPVRMTGIHLDITEQKEAEEVLHRGQQLFQTLVENSPDIIARYDGDCRRIYVNPAYLKESGMSTEQLLHARPSEVSPMPKASAQALQELISRVMTTGQSGTIDVFWPKAGMDSWYNVSASPEFDRTGRVQSVITISRDITARKRDEEMVKAVNLDLEQRVAERTEALKQKSSELKKNQLALMNIVEDLNAQTVALEEANTKLKELDLLKSMFIASMSHELRTPLNSIIGYSSILLNEWVGPLSDEQKEDLAAILRSGKHLLSLINDVIDVSRIEAGKIELLLEDIDVKDVVADVVEVVRKEAEAKALKVQVESASLILRTDRRRVMQCLLNLVGNAVKYTKAGTVTISATVSDDQYLVLRVSDTGIGIHSDDLPRLFLPFVRFREAQASVIPGTGLGLYLTRKLVRDILKGTIYAESTYGVGSQFTIRLPLSLPSGGPPTAD